jgi:hypothetical protein
MEEEIVNKFISMNSLNNPFLVTMKNKDGNISFKFDTIKKFIVLLIEEGENLYVNNLFFRTMKFSLANNDYNKKDLKVLNTDDIGMLQYALKMKSFNYKGRDKRYNIKLYEQSNLKIAELTDWQDSLMKHFSFLIATKEKISNSVDKIPVKFPITASKAIVNLNSNGQSEVIAKNLENEMDKNANNKGLYIVTLNSNNKPSKKKINLPLNPFSVEYISRIIDNKNFNLEFYNKFVKLALNAEDFTNTNINENYKKKYNLKLLKSQDNFAYKIKNLKLSYNSIMNILKLSQCKLNIKTTKYKAEELLNAILKKRKLRLETAFEKWKKAEKLTLTLRRLKTRAISTKCNYYLSIFKPNNKIPLHTVLNPNSIAKIYKLLDHDITNNPDHMLYRFKHDFSNQNFQALKKYESRIFGVYVPQVLNNFQYKIKHFFIRSKSMNKILKQCDDKAIMQYRFHPINQMMKVLLKVRFNVISVRSYFIKWKYMALKLKRKEAKGKYSRLRKPNFISDKAKTDNLDFEKIIIQGIDKNFPQYKQLNKDVKVCLNKACLDISNYLFANIHLSQAVDKLDIIEINKPIPEYIKFEEILKDKNSCRNKKLREAMFFPNKNNYASIALEAYKPIGNNSNKFLNFQEAQKDKTNSMKLYMINIACKKILNPTFEKLYIVAGNNRFDNFQECKKDSIRNNSAKLITSYNAWNKHKACAKDSRIFEEEGTIKLSKDHKISSCMTLHEIAPERNETKLSQDQSKYLLIFRSIR